MTLDAMGGMPQAGENPTKGPEVPLNLLLVEDVQGDADYVCDRLTEVRTPAFDVVHVKRLRDALDRLRRDRFDVALLDLGLPDAKGVETLAQILELVPTLPVVVFTGNGDEDVARRAMQAGAEDFLTKGIAAGRHIAKSLLYAIDRSKWRGQLRQLIEKNADAMIVADRRRSIVYANRAAERLFGRSLAELRGTEFPYGLDATSSHQIEIPRPGETEGIHAEMRVVAIEWRGVPAFLASIRDVTDRVKAQELERLLLHANRLASLGQLAAGVAHEVNNPTTYLLTNLEVLLGQIKHVIRAHGTLRDRLADEEGPRSVRVYDEVASATDLAQVLGNVDEVIADCLSGVRRIAATVRQLSSFSRIEREDLERFSPNLAVQDACKIAGAELYQRARLELRLAEVPQVAGARARLTQAILNLVINAVHAMDSADFERNWIRVVTRQHEGSVLIEVQDNGSGIPEHLRARIFEPFYTTKPRGEGTGLGLALAAETIRKHGGTLGVDSRLGEGTCFTITLPPCGPAPQMVEARGEGPKSVPSRPDRRLRVLLIDDDTTLRRALRRALGSAYEVIEAASGAEALATLELDRGFDVILCDLMMPGLDGPQVYAKIRELDPACCERMLFLTGGAFTERAQQFLRDQERVVLQKPIPSKELREAIDRAASRGENGSGASS